MQHIKHDTFLEDKGFGFYKKRHHLQSQLTLELLSIIVVKKYGGEIKNFSNVLMRADIAYNSSSTSRAQTNDLGGINYLYK